MNEPRLAVDDSVTCTASRPVKKQIGLARRLHSVNVGLICRLLILVFALIGSVMSRSVAVRAAQAPSPIPVHRCVADPNGKIDFQGHLGSAGGLSDVRIFSTTDVSDYYLNALQSQLGTGSSPIPSVTSVEQADALVQMTQKLPSMLANAYLAQIVDGAFTCMGFSPGRYSFLAEVHGNGAHPGDPPLGISYYRADVDVSSLTHRAVVIVQGFRRIGTNPPER